MNKWLKDTIFYQIYPTSFYDSNGDGIGDFQGIYEKLPYLKELGINGIWFNPFYDSPFMDGGYDITDYCSVNSKFGTMEDFEKVVNKCKQLGIRVVIDIVIGHTSNMHPWFLQSAKNEHNKYSDRYIWTDSIFNKYQDKTIHGLYERDGGFYINYYACQPALNYGFNKIEKNYVKKHEYDLGENWKMHYSDERLKPLREDLLNIMRFWMNKGIDGFRVDLANSLVKGCVYDSDNDEDIEGLKWLWNILIGTMKKEYPDMAFIAEWVYPSNSVGKCYFDLDYLGHDRPEYNSLFRNEKDTNILSNFERGNNYFSPNGKGDVSSFVNYISRLYKEVEGKGYFSVPSGYHDIIRLGEKKDLSTLKVVFAMLLTLKHVPFIYYGDEIGMKHTYNINKDGGFIRTGCRTPMVWNDSKNGGFSNADETYLPVVDKTRNVLSMESKNDSLLNTVKELIKLRKQYSCLNADGEFKVLKMDNNGYPFIYERKDTNNSIIVCLNPSSNSYSVKIEYSKVLFNNNCTISNEITLNKESFIILER